MDISSKFFVHSKSDLLQQSCILCGSDSAKGLCLCQPCLDELPYIEHACKKCGVPTVEETIHCGACITEMPQNHQTISVLHYHSPVDHLIQKMKYHNQLEIADLLGKLLVRKLLSLDYELPEQIIPVPLHISRLQQRGYNQAVEIARPVSKALNIPLNLTNCIRTRLTEPQVDLSHAERQKNLKNAFDIIHQIGARHVAIIDDVMTTGSTLNELTATLLKSGIEKVDIWTCSRATLS